MHPNNYNYDKNLDSSHKMGEDVALRRRSAGKNSTGKQHQMVDYEDDQNLRVRSGEKALEQKRLHQ